MSTASPENGCASSEDLKTRKSLKSSVIPDNDPLKIKLKISKRDISEVEVNDTEFPNWKPIKNCKMNSLEKPELKNGNEKGDEEIDLQDERLTKTNNGGDPKMKLRSKREADEELEFRKDENEGGSEEKKKRKESLAEDVDRPLKKRIRTTKCFGDGFLEEGNYRRRSRRNDNETSGSEKPKHNSDILVDINKESFCWTCHKDGSVVKCDTCPRVFHLKCVSLSKDPSKDWICPECSLVLHAEKISTRSEAMKSLSLDQLCTLLKFAIDRMKNVPESEAFWKPVDPKEVPFYDKYITNPMDLNLLERNMKSKMYGSPQAFLADAKWLLHNSIIFNSTQSPLTSTARFLVKICRQEMAEIENCPDCYLNAHTKEKWFIEVCRKPHILIWARLKGFPFWPAKAMSTNLKTQQVDARFFGAHDKAWVPVKECYLYSKNSPQLINKKRADLDEAFLEAEGYIKKIKQKYGTFCYAPDKAPFLPELYDKQLQSMIPNYKEEKPLKKKRKSDQSAGENGVVEKPLQIGKKEQEGSQRAKPNKMTIDEAPKDDRELCAVSDYVSEEKVANDDRLSLEDEIARSLEIFDTHKKVEGDTLDENSTDMDEDGSIRIPEHGYSRTIIDPEVVESSSSNIDDSSESEKNEKETDQEERENNKDENRNVKNDTENGKREEKMNETPIEILKNRKDTNKEETEINKIEPKSNENEKEINENLADMNINEREINKNEAEMNISGKKSDEDQAEINKNEKEINNRTETDKIEQESSKTIVEKGCKPSVKECESSDGTTSDEVSKVSVDEKAENVSSLKATNDQCEVSSTSADLKSIDFVERDNNVKLTKIESTAEESKSEEKIQTATEDSGNSIKDKSLAKALGKEEEKSQKSFVNLTCDQQQKILTEAKLLANIDEMTALDKQKVLNELGLDASQVDIRQLAEENRQILETLNKKCQNEKKVFEEIDIKDEDFEQYLLEENNEDNYFDEDIPPVSPKCDSAAVNDNQNSSKNQSGSNLGKSSSGPMLKIKDVQSLKDLAQKDFKMKRKKSFEESSKTEPEPVSKLAKLDQSMEKLNRKLRLSDEVSLLMVDGEKKVNVECVKTDSTKVPKKLGKSPRARKSIPTRGKVPSDDASKVPPKNVNVISVDTENSAAQKNLLRSLCLEEKKQDDPGIKTVLITTNEKGIKNVDMKTSCDLIAKKQMKEISLEAVKGSDAGKDGSAQKNLTVMANPHLIVTNNGPAIVATPNNHPNLALAQNNLGQLSLVHLSNLTSGIQTNFINLTNETIGFNNPLGTLYASPGLSAEFPPNSRTASVILTPSLPTSSTVNPGNQQSKDGKIGSDQLKVPVGKVGPSKPVSGISVKSPASLGLVTAQPGKLPPMVTMPGDGIPLTGELGPVTAELNKHSVKMAEYMRATIEDILRELSNQGSLEAKYKMLSIEMEKLQWRHQQEIMELKHHSERSMMELRSSLESEKQKCLAELKTQLESQHQKVISETKRKQWCANCGKEALFYCCWNTSYCDYPCQQQHWPGHMSTCAQLGNNVTIGSATGSQLQSKAPGVRHSNYVPIMPKGEGISKGVGSHTGGIFATNRVTSTAQVRFSGAQTPRRPSDPSVPQLPINITIRPQQYFL